MESQWYSTTTVAKMFEVKVGTVRGWIREGRIEASKFRDGGHWRVSHEELTRFANELLEKK